MNNNKRPKGTRELVIDIFAEHPEWNATQVHERYKILIGDPTRAVGLSSIQKYLEEMKPPYNEDKKEGLEEHWHIGIMAKNYNIPADAVPYIVMVQNWVKQNMDPIFNKPLEPLSVRDALWISRLYAMWSLDGLQSKDMPGIAYALYSWAKAYSRRERICKLLKKEFDTYELDQALSERARPVIVGKSILMFFKDDSFSIDSADPEILNRFKAGE